MTIVVPGDDRILDQIRKQLSKLVEVFDVHDFSMEARDLVNRELVLCKVSATAEKRNELIQIANVFRARVADIHEDTMIFEATGSESKVQAFLNLMKPFGILEVARSGRVAMAREKHEAPQEVLQIA